MPKRSTTPSSSGSTRKKPEKPHSATAREREQREALAAEIAARQHAAQFVLAAAENFLEIGRRRPGDDCGPEPQGPLPPPEPHGPPPCRLIVHGIVINLPAPARSAGGPCRDGL